MNVHAFIKLSPITLFSGQFSINSSKLEALDRFLFLLVVANAFKNKDFENYGRSIIQVILGNMCVHTL